MSPILSKLHQKAVSAINQGNYLEVDRLCNDILSRDDRFADAWFLKGMAAASQMNIGLALSCVESALKIDIKNAEYLTQYAKLCVLVNRNHQAREAANRAMLLKPRAALTLDTLGVVYSKLGEYEKAQTALKFAVKVLPNNPQFHFNLASAEQFLGNETEAELHYLKAIELRPDFSRAYWALSELKKNKHDPERVRTLESLLEGELSDDDELYYCHALSREMEKLEDYSRAFELLERGKFRYRSKLNYSWVVDERLFSEIRSAFPKARPLDSEREQGKDAIFVLGMPRSGTTLVERILSSHSNVESLGELQNFGLAVKRESNTQGRTVLDQTVAKSMPNLNFDRVGETYLSSLASRSESNKRFIDKMPLNFLYLGAIFEALPAAKVVCLRRNPMDTCLSNFRQLFAVSFSYYNYHYDLVDTGNYFRMFDELMRHWLELYGNRIHIVDYEELTRSPEGNIRGILDYCELDWEPQCLDFHKNSSAVATASAMQVREPIYRSAVQRWKKYEAQLQPLIDIFEAAGIQYD